MDEDQLTWFQDELSNSTSQWKLVGNQVIFAQLLLAPLDPLFPGVVNQFLDIWDGYPAERLKIIDHVIDENIQDILMVTGDFHSTLAFDVTRHPLDTAYYDGITGDGSSFVEFTVPSVTSFNFDENLDLVTASQLEGILPSLHPHQKVVDLIDHGYMILDITPEKSQNDWFFMETIKSPETEEYFFKGAFTNAGENRLNVSNSPAAEKSDPAPLAGVVGVSIEELDSESVTVIGVYPNPASELIWVNYALHTSTHASITMLDIQGRIIAQENYKNLTPGLYDLKMVLSDISPGEYFVRLETENGIKSFPVIIQ